MEPNRHEPVGKKESSSSRASVEREAHGQGSGTGRDGYMGHTGYGREGFTGHPGSGRDANMGYPGTGRDATIGYPGSGRDPNMGYPGTGKDASMGFSGSGRDLYMGPHGFGREGYVGNTGSGRRLGYSMYDLAKKPAVSGFSLSLRLFKSTHKGSSNPKDALGPTYLFFSLIGVDMTDGRGDVGAVRRREYAQIATEMHIIPQRAAATREPEAYTPGHGEGSLRRQGEFSPMGRYTPKERMFLEAAEKGDKATLMRCLQPPSPVNVNVTNMVGRSALTMAVDNENIEIVELLLGQPDIKIGNALLYAIREGVYRIVEMMVNHPSITPNMLGEEWCNTIDPGEECFDYSPDISPVILAAQLNQFEILQLLLSQGANISKPMLGYKPTSTKDARRGNCGQMASVAQRLERWTRNREVPGSILTVARRSTLHDFPTYTPHNLTCECDSCTERIKADSLRYSLHRISTYRALASPAWISLTSTDPILTAFRLSWELFNLAQLENEFKEPYLELVEECRTYAVQLLDQCRSSEEVIAVLNQNPSTPNRTGAYDKYDRVVTDTQKVLVSRVLTHSEPHAPGSVAPLQVVFQMVLSCALCQAVAASRPTLLRSAFSWSPHLRLGLPLGLDQPVGVAAFSRLAASRGGSALAKLKLALKYEQKQFVSHPHCQQLLTTIWYESLPGWRKRNIFTKVFILMSLISLLPFMAFYYILHPRSKVGRFMRNPFMKFLSQSGSFAVFLILLTMASPREENMTNRRGPPPSTVEVLIVFYVAGMVWNECKQLWEEGLHSYVREWWNWMDFMMNSLYLATISLRLVAYVRITSGTAGPKDLERSFWPPDDPTLISEGLFSVANVFSFFRIIYLFQANPHLGPLQISLGCMLIDIGKFLSVFFLVLMSFAFGLNQLYGFYADTEECLSEGDACSSFQALFWSLFGLTPLTTLELKEGHRFVISVGSLLLGAYHIAAIIMLLNMLIAMMSTSFQEVESYQLSLCTSAPGVSETAPPQFFCLRGFQVTACLVVLSVGSLDPSQDRERCNTNHADLEWKFARTKLWLGYFDEGSTLPPPYNIIITPKSMYYFIKAVRQKWPEWQDRMQTIRRSLSSRRDGPPPPPAGAAQQHPADTSTDPPAESEESPDCEKARPPEQGPSTDQIYQVCTRSIRYGPDLSGMDQIYQSVMQRLVRRYIHRYKQAQSTDGVSEDDLAEIKQDISSL
ncbi:anthranilate synthase component II, variant, partial [Branchiostoma belcheri]